MIYLKQAKANKNKQANKQKLNKAKNAGNRSFCKIYSHV
jgi:hypothetical protein